MIVYTNSLEGINEENLDSVFFHEWPNPPSIKHLYMILKNSSYIYVAIHTETKKVVGFINALSDQVLTAYIPLLEVTPAFKNQGIGTQLVERMLEQLKDYYMIDLLCDADLQDYYSQKGMIKAAGMMKRNYNNQSGKNI
ncbi:GNAT family N-acetyltransferase [Paenibacillus pini]|uniref:GNAT family N-acetyltransferase n=1 Tax=Paenibacillus pini TaxID=669461 RepID=UPI000AF994D8|nr:GNAT family N-acetyltransferase [Paenibacillus pini]